MVVWDKNVLKKIVQRKIYIYIYIYLYIYEYIYIYIPTVQQRKSSERLRNKKPPENNKLDTEIKSYDSTYVIYSIRGENTRGICRLKKYHSVVKKHELKNY